MYVLGLMSGTSADGVDAALVDFNGNLNKPIWQLLNSVSLEYPGDLKKIIIEVGQGRTLSSAQWLTLSEEITEVHFSAAKNCDPNGLARVIGCHGQTVFHRPPEISSRGASMQIIQAPLLATLLGKPVVFDFRSKDLALGGHGAPLSPLLDLALIGSANGWRGVLNLGGIANLTLIPPLFGPHRHWAALGWDCGPANTLIDFAVQRVSDGENYFDRDGLLALEGAPDFKAINRWLKEDFFQIPPPKSTGREQFGLQDLDRRLLEIASQKKTDLIATMTAFSASIIGQDLKNLYQSKGIQLVDLFVAGGGSKNPALMNEIRKQCRGVRVVRTEMIGIPVQIREAMAFALLAWWFMHNKLTTNIFTGAQRESVLGSLVRP